MKSLKNLERNPPTDMSRRRATLGAASKEAD
jgi:hypothetical protein